MLEIKKVDTTEKGQVRRAQVQVPLFTGIYPEEYEKSLSTDDGTDPVAAGSSGG